ncbi:MAG: 4-alpha-glucanotransferase [Betaproteobacteria bacterium]|nr:4-alpha-glucanotransferase [Betaproteobacteria bacterium]
MVNLSNNTNTGNTTSGSLLLAQRRAGVLLHVSSLPSAFYVGDVGIEAYRFIDFLHEIGATVWQTLPINMPHTDNSPYQCLSAHAGNPDFISLEALQKQKLLTQEDLRAFAISRSPDKSQDKSHLLAKAYLVFHQQATAEQQRNFEAFCSHHGHWLDDFALFIGLRKKFNLAGWHDWPDEYKRREKKALARVKKELAQEIAINKFIQFVFFEQWSALKAYAASKEIKLFGDIPIFVAYDSADVWAQPHLFKLDAEGKMTVVAGVPPDYFSATGQRWGNPHYDWEAMAQEGYRWWISRMATQNALFDIVRIDHFRGLEAAWEILASEETAINGQWVAAPGEALLAAILQALPSITLVAEDLGIITAEVDALRNKYHLPGMKILQFAFGGEEDNPYLPHHIEENSVVYTGTHDNDTTVGWYDALDDNQRKHLYAYLQKNRFIPHEVSMPNDLMDMALMSQGVLVIIPMQDILALDTHHRMNVPGTASGNWHWRFDWQQLQPEQKAHMTEVIKRSRR